MGKKRTKRIRKKDAKKTARKSNSFIIIATKILLALIVPAIFFSLPDNKLWLERRAITYFKDMGRQMNNMEVEFRKRERHGITYQIANYVCNNVPKDSWFLMPPQAFYLDRIYASSNANVQEIYRFISQVNIFAFHCMDLNLLDMQMERNELSKAQYTLDVQPNGNMAVIQISSPEILDQVLQRFNYDYDLAMTQSAAITIVNDLKSKK